MANFIAPELSSTFFIPGSNTPGNGVQLFIYTNLSTTKTTSYVSKSGAAHTNPIVLDSGGNLPSQSQVWIPAGTTITAVYAPSNDTDPPASPYLTINDLSGLNDVSATASQWETGPTPTYISGTSFSLVGDQTTDAHIGRRIQTTNTGGTVYSRITSSAFGALTTVGVTNESGALDSGLSALNYALLTATNPSVPLLSSFYPLSRNSSNAAGILSLNLINVSTGITITPQSTSGTMALTSDFAYQNLPGINGRLLLPDDYITGYTISNNASTTAMNISAGMAMDSGNTVNIISSGLSNKTQSNFSAGASSGAKLTAAAMSTNAWYAWYALGGSSGAADFGFDTVFPPGVPTTTAAFPYYRYIGGRKTRSSTTTWDSFVQHGDDVLWSHIPALDMNGAMTSANRTLVTMNIPPVRAKWWGHWYAGLTNSFTYTLFTDPSQEDVAVGNGTSPLASSGFDNQTTTSIATQNQIYCWANTSSQVGVRGANTNNILVQTMGWMDPRGKPVD